MNKVYKANAKKETTTTAAQKQQKANKTMPLIITVLQASYQICTYVCM